jgi:hypothetical protein
MNKFIRRIQIISIVMVLVISGIGTMSRKSTS